MDEWEVWDLAVDEKALNDFETSEQQENHVNDNESNISSSGTEETKEIERSIERSTRVSVRRSFHGDSSLDLTSTSPGPQEDSALEEVSITYVFKERTKSNDNLLTKSYDHSLSSTPRRNKFSFRQSLRERLSLNFNNNNEKPNSSGEEREETTTKLNIKDRVLSRLTSRSTLTAENQTNMISRSRSMEHLRQHQKDDNFGKSSGRNSSLSEAQSKRHFSATRSDLTSVGLHSDEEDDQINVFLDSSDDHLDSTKNFENSDQFTVQNSSTPKKSIDRSHSYTDIKKIKNNHGGEDIYLLSVPTKTSRNNSISRSKSLENVHHQKMMPTKPEDRSTSPNRSPVLRRPKARTYSDSLKLDSGYFSPDDLRKDSEGNTPTETKTPSYTITFTPEKSNSDESQHTSNHTTPSIAQGLASMIPLGVGETMLDGHNTDNIIHNVESVHSVEEHGTFNLKLEEHQHDFELSFTEEEEYVDIDFVYEDEEPTMESREEREGDSIEEEHSDGELINDVIDDHSHNAENEEDEGYKNFEKGLREGQKAIDETDCPKYRLLNPNLTPLQIRVHSPNGSLDEDGFQIMHSTDPNINHEDPSFESVEEENESPGSSSPERRRTSSNECQSPFEDSIQSFEAHERECASTAPGTPVDISFGDDFDVIEDGNDRRMTLALLDYLPPINEDVEEANSNCGASVDEGDEDLPLAITAPENDEHKRTLSAENLRLHNQENGQEPVKKTILEDFLSTGASSPDPVFKDEINNNKDNTSEKELALDTPDSTITRPIKDATSDENQTLKSGSDDKQKGDVIIVEEQIVVTEEVIHLEGRPPSPVPDILVEEVQISDEKDDEDDNTTLILKQQNADFTSRYTLTDVSDLDSDEELDDLEPPATSKEAVKPVADSLDDNLPNEPEPQADDQQSSSAQNTIANPTDQIVTTTTEDEVTAHEQLTTIDPKIPQQQPNETSATHESEDTPELSQPLVSTEPIDFNHQTTDDTRELTLDSEVTSSNDSEATEMVKTSLSPDKRPHELSLDDSISSEQSVDKIPLSPAVDMSILTEDIKEAEVSTLPEPTLSSYASIGSIENNAKDDTQTETNEELEKKNSELNIHNNDVNETPEPQNPEEIQESQPVNESLNKESIPTSVSDESETEQTEPNEENCNNVDETNKVLENPEIDNKNLESLGEHQKLPLIETINLISDDNEDQDQVSELSQQTLQIKHMPRQQTIEDAILSNQMKQDQPSLKRDPSLAWDDYQTNYIEDDYYDQDNKVDSKLDDNTTVSNPVESLVSKLDGSENVIEEKLDSKLSDNVAITENEEDKNNDSCSSENALEMYESVENESVISEEVLSTPSDDKEVEPIQTSEGISSTPEPTKLTPEEMEGLLTELEDNQISTITRILRFKDHHQCTHLLKKKIHNTNVYTIYYLHLSTSEFDHDQTDNGFKLYELLSHQDMDQFALVLNDLLCYLGVIKSEHPVPNNINVKTLLRYLTQLIQHNDLDAHTIQTFVYFLIKPSENLSKHHKERVEFVEACYHAEMRALSQDTANIDSLMNRAFEKLSTYLVHLDKERSKEITKEHIIQKITDENFNQFAIGAFMFMGLLKSEEHVATTNDLSAPLYLLDYILESMETLPKSSYYILTAFLGEKLSRKYKFCNKQRITLYNKLMNK
ncbi:uro-adherence factor A-like [Clytia hemisphaerica]